MVQEAEAHGGGGAGESLGLPDVLGGGLGVAGGVVVDEDEGAGAAAHREADHFARVIEDFVRRARADSLA